MRKPYTACLRRLDANRRAANVVGVAQEWALGTSVLVAGVGAAAAHVRSVLCRAGIQVRTESDGTAALAAVRGSPPDMLVAERHLPGLDGLELCRGVRSDAELRDLYVSVVLEPTDRGTGAGEVLAAGGDDYLLEPFEPFELLAQVRTGLRLSHLGASEARLRALLVMLPGAVYRCAMDSDWTMDLISAEIEAITGYPPSDFESNARRSYASVIHPDDRAPVEQAVAAATEHGRPFSLEYRILRADGSTGWVLERGQLVRAPGGRVWLDGAIFDLTARKRTEEELRANRARQAADAERSRIARELHDSVSQALFSMTLHARAAQIALQRDASTADGPAADNVAQLRELTQGALAEMRALIFELRPDALRDEGLVSAVRKQSDALAARSGVQVTVTADLEHWTLDDLAEEELYRLVLEALNNVVKHASATRAEVRLGRCDGARVVEVCDDGIGFDATHARPGHLGLATMRERAARAGGHFELDTAPGAGTTVRVILDEAGSDDGGAA